MTAVRLVIALMMPGILIGCAETAPDLGPAVTEWGGSVGKITHRGVQDEVTIGGGVSVGAGVGE